MFILRSISQLHKNLSYLNKKYVNDFQTRFLIQSFEKINVVKNLPVD